MKKALGILLALVLVLAFSVPVMASVTEVEMIGSDENAYVPIVKAKWETSDSWCSADDDPTKSGTQVNPNVPQGNVTAYFWAVVTDKPLADIKHVWAEIYHPDGTLKVQIELEQMYCTPWTEANWLQAAECLGYADEADLVTYGSTNLDGDAIDFDDVYTELFKGEAKMYRGELTLEHGQPGGFYSVEVYAQDQDSTSVRLVNCFEYVRMVCIEQDFTTVDFGKLKIDEIQKVSGDEDMTTLNKPTLKNGGNADTTVSVHFSEMYYVDTAGVLTDVELEVVTFDARLGALLTVDPIDPCVPTVIGDIPICNTWELDLSIHPIKLAQDEAGVNLVGIYRGTITITGEDNGSPTPGTPCPPLPMMP